MILAQTEQLEKSIGTDFVLNGYIVIQEWAQNFGREFEAQVRDNITLEIKTIIQNEINNVGRVVQE